MLVSHLLLAVLAPSTSLAASITPKRHAGGAIQCSSIPPPEVPGAKVVDFTAKERYNVTGPVRRDELGAIETIAGLDVCNVNVTLSHRGAGDEVSFEVWLPLSGWNGRFQGVGGSGWLAGYHGTRGLGIAVEQGFAAASTDGGNVSDSEGYLNGDMVSDGVVDMGRLFDFSATALHEIAVVGKAVTASFYGKPAHHSYFTGCSQGGRQGYELAQRYPGDFDGILANAPAIQWPGLFLALGWGEFVMRWKGHSPSMCVYEGFRKASVKACDGLDGVLDGVISNDEACRFDPYTLVGHEVECEGETETVAAEDAEVLELIHQGPRSAQGTQLWKPFPWGITYNAVVLVGPDWSAMWNDWYRFFVMKDGDYDVESLDTLEELTDLFATSIAEYAGTIGTDNPDLAGLRDTGHKLLSWHGSADDTIPLEDTIAYRKDVESIMGGNDAVNEFYRFFVAPGVSHCILGDGAYPVDAFEALFEWVEGGSTPEELHGTMLTPKGETAERKMCPWPLVARYDGESDPNKAGSYHCA